MRKIFLGVCCTVILCSVLSCKYVPKFTIKNTSNQAIYHAFSFSYPDTTVGAIKDAIPYFMGNKEQKILAQDFQTTSFSFNRNPTCLMFIFDAQTVETTPWDSIVKHNKILKRYQFTENDLDRMNWTITYP